jgi:hypothetical protein
MAIVFLPSVRTDGIATGQAKSISFPLFRRDVIEIAPGPRRTFYAWRKNRGAAITAESIRFFLQVDPQTMFSPGCGYTIADLGNQTTNIANVEICLYNPLPVPAVPRLLVRAWNGTSYTTVFVSEYTRAGVPVYTEVYANGAAGQTEVAVFYDDPTTPVADFTGVTFASTIMGRVRVGYLNLIGNADPAPESVFVSGLAGRDSQTALYSSYIGPYEAFPPPPLQEGFQSNFPIDGALFEDWVHYQTQEPLAFWGKNTQDPESFPHSFIPSSAFRIAENQQSNTPPAVCQGKVCFASKTAAGTTIFVMDAATGQYLGSYTPSIGIASTSTLTLSGNEITDATRGLRTQGDGLLNDNSIGIWDFATNLVLNGGFETDVTQWTANGTGVVLTRVTGDSKFGTAAMQLASGTGVTQRAFTQVLATGTIGAVYTASAWAKAGNAQTVGRSFDLQIFEATPVAGTVASITLTNTWQKVTVTRTLTSTGIVQVYVGEGSGGATGDVQLVDGVQFETGPVATPYIQTNGATASRSAARVRFGSTFIDNVQAWVAIRFRWGWGAANEPGAGGGLPRLLSWDAAPGFYSFSYQESSNQITLQRGNGFTSETAAQAVTPVRGAEGLAIAAWTSTGIKVSVNGAAFTSTAGTSVPLTGLNALVDLFRRTIAADSYFDGDLLWMATGKGVLTDADATSLFSVGSAAPTTLTLPSTAVMTGVLTRSPDQTFVSYTYPQVHSNFVPEVTDDGVHYLLDDSQSVLCFDPVLCAPRWMRKFATQNITGFRRWTGDGKFLITYIDPANGNQQRYVVKDEDGLDVYSAFAGGAYSPPLSLDTDKSIYVSNTAGTQLFRHSLVLGVCSILNSQTAPATSYFLSPTSNAGQIPSPRFQTVVASPSALYAVRATPDFATNNNPQTLVLDSFTKDLVTKNWQITLCTNAFAVTGWGCRFGSLRTDDSGLIYATYFYYDANGIGRWYMRVFEPVAGAPLTPEIPVPGPGYPLPSSAQGGKLRYAVLQQDYAACTKVNGPVAYWRLNRLNGLLYYDSSGNALNGTITNAAVATVVAGLLPKDPDGAFSFAGSTSLAASAQTTHDTRLNPGIGSMTWDLVFQTVGVFTNGLTAFYRKSDASNFNGVTIGIGNATRPGGVRVQVTGPTAGQNAQVTSTLDYNDGLPHHVRAVLDRTTNTLTLYVDGVSVGSADASSLAGVNLNSTSNAYIGGYANNASYSFQGVIDEVAVYPVPLSAPSASSRQFFLSGPAVAERWLDTLGTFTYGTGDVEVDIANSFTPADTPPLDPHSRLPISLIPKIIEPGGILEVLQNQNGELVRLAYASDVLAGLQATVSLANLDTLTFEIGLDRFVPAADGTGAWLSQLQRSWQTSVADSTISTPFDKVRLFRDDVYLRYTEKTGRRRLYRVQTIDREANAALAGTAVDAAVTLSDYLTQYEVGRSQFTGQAPSEIASRILAGDQALNVTNRKFSPDTPVRMDIADEVPDMTPTAPASTYMLQPLPFIPQLPAVNPDDAAAFSGLPHETVGPDGTTRALASGALAYLSWNETGATQLGWYQGAPIQDQIRALSLDISGSLGGTENATYVSRVVYGCIYAPTAGRYSFRLATTNNSARVYFRHHLIVSELSGSPGHATYSWSSDLKANTWYPIIIHHTNGATAPDLHLYWTTPGASEVLIPVNRLSAQMHGGLFPVRFVDVNGAVRWMHAYKRWDGKGIVLAYPIRTVFPAYVVAGQQFSWPAAVPVGTLIEEVRFPADSSLSPIVDWGSGWTRRPGTAYRDVPSQALSVFQGKIRNY